MEKPFDKANLVERLKAQGLPIAEEAVETVVKELFSWTKESLAIHPNALVKAIGLPAVEILQPLALQAVDKIDGQVG